MEFVSYTLYELVGLIQGLGAGKLVTQALKAGNLLAPIIYLMLFLTVFKIAFEVIGRKNYLQAGKDFVFFLIFLFLFTYTFPATIYYVNIAQGFTDKKLKTGWATNSEITVEDGFKVRLNGVPSAMILASIPDVFVFHITKTFIAPDNKNNLEWQMRLYPGLFLYSTFIKYVQQEKQANDRMTRFANLSIALKVDRYLEAQGEKGEKIAEELRKGATVSPYDRWRLTAIRKEYSDFMLSEAKKVLKDEKDQPLLNFYDELSKQIKEGVIPVLLQKGIADGMLASELGKTITKDSAGTVRKNLSTLQQIFMNITASFKEAVSEYVNDLFLSLKIMYKMQEVMIFILLALLPVVITLAFLPIFGYNFKLLFTYMFSIFLVKMWIPLFALAEKVLYGDMIGVISNVLAFFIPLFPATAFAGTGAYALLFSAVETTSEHNHVLLNAMALGIPGTLGGIATLVFGGHLAFAVKNAMDSASHSLLHMGSVALRFAKSGKSGRSDKDSGMERVRVADTPSTESKTAETINKSAEPEAITTEKHPAGGTVTTYWTKSSGGILIQGTKHVDVRKGGFGGSIGGQRGGAVHFHKARREKPDIPSGWTFKNGIIVKS